MKGLKIKKKTNLRNLRVKLQVIKNIFYSKTQTANIHGRRKEEC